MSKKKQIKPEWFEGTVYKKGAKVQNPFSGETCRLNGKELSMYDFIIGATRVLESLHDNKTEPNDNTDKLYDDLHNGLKWFQKNNAKAYMILLD